MKKRDVVLLVAVCTLLSLMVWQLLRIGGQGESLYRAPTDRVGMILNGSAEDRGFHQSLYEAAFAVCEEKGLAFVSRDGVAAGEPFRDIAEEMIGEGCGLILCDSEDFDEDLTALSQAHPGVCFLNAMGTVHAHNLASCMRRTYQARYLTGIVAGMQTETGEIGYVVSTLSLETIRQLNAFTIGVRRANPTARVFVRCTGDRYDEDAAARAARELLEAHEIDVLTHHATPVSALREADARGVWTIGYSLHGENPFPDTWLTGYTFDWKPFYTKRIEEWQEHRFVGQQYRGGIRNGLVSLSPLSELVRDGTQQAVDDALSRLLDGSYDVFFGPITDSYGTLRIREGETLTDERILHGMFWYVEGVVLE